jgi:hypothetical protein
MLMMAYNVPVFNLLGHCQEGLFNVGGILGWRLQEGNGELIREFLNKPSDKAKGRNHSILTDLSHTVFHNLLARQIWLITHKQFVNPLRCVTVDFL